jgi:hypothetical protein
MQEDHEFKAKAYKIRSYLKNKTKLLGTCQTPEASLKEFAGYIWDN